MAVLSNNDTNVTDPAQGALNDRLKVARVSSPFRSMRSANKAAEAIGVSRQSLYRYEQAGTLVPSWVIRRAAEVYGVPITALIPDLETIPEDFLPTRYGSPIKGDLLPVAGPADSFLLRSPSMLRAAGFKDKADFDQFWDSSQSPPGGTAMSPPAQANTQRTFATDAEKISYTIGVLDMANAAKSELSRCLDTAMAALLSPLTAPTPVVAGPTVAELVEKHAAAIRTAPAVAAQTPAVAKAKGRR